MKPLSKAELDITLGLAMLYVCNSLTPFDEFMLNSWRSLSEENERIFQILISPEVSGELLEEFNRNKNRDLKQVQGAVSETSFGRDS